MPRGDRRPEQATQASPARTAGGACPSRRRRGRPRPAGRRDDEGGSDQDRCGPSSDEARAQLRDPQHRRVQQLILALAGTALLPGGEGPEQREAAEHQETGPAQKLREDIGRRSTRGAGGRTPSAAAEDREHDQPQAARRQGYARPVQPPTRLGRGGRGSPGRAGTRSRTTSDGHVAPGVLRRQPSLISGRPGPRRCDATDRRRRDAAASLDAGGGGTLRSSGSRALRRTLDPRPDNQQNATFGPRDVAQRPDPSIARPIAKVRLRPRMRRASRRQDGTPPSPARRRVIADSDPGWGVGGRPRSARSRRRPAPVDTITNPARPAQWTWGPAHHPRPPKAVGHGPPPHLQLPTAGATSVAAPPGTSGRGGTRGA